MCAVRFVEENYNLEIGNAQVTQLSKAITSGAEKNIFALPKGENLPGRNRTRRLY